MLACWRGSQHVAPAVIRLASSAPPLVAGKSKVTVRFQATGGNEIAAVFGLRTIRADAPLE